MLKWQPLALQPLASSFAVALQPLATLSTRASALEVLDECQNKLTTCAANVEKAAEYADKTTTALKATQLSYAGALTLDVDGNNRIDSNDAVQLYIAVAMHGFGAAQFLATFQSKLSHTAKRPSAIVRDVTEATAEFNSDHPVHTFACTCTEQCGEGCTFKLTYGENEVGGIPCNANQATVSTKFRQLQGVHADGTVTFTGPACTSAGTHATGTHAMIFEFKDCPSPRPAFNAVGEGNNHPTLVHSWGLGSTGSTPSTDSTCSSTYFRNELWTMGSSWEEGWWSRYMRLFD